MKLYTLKNISALILAGMCPLAFAMEMEDSKERALFSAACTGDVVQARTLLREGVCVDARSALGYTPAMVAADEGHASLVQLFLAHGANLEACDSLGVTALALAHASKHAPVVKLLKHASTHGSAATREKDVLLTPEHLFSLADRGDLQKLEPIVVVTPESITWKDEFGMNVLMRSAHKGHNDVVTFLLDRYCSLGITSFGTPLHAAVAGKQLSTMKLLLVRGISVDSGDEDNATPLMRAARDGFGIGGLLLLAHHADINACTCKGETALMCAVNGGQVPFVRMLLTMGANVEAKDAAGKTALSRAVAAKNTKIEKILDYQIARNSELLNAAFDGDLLKVHEALAHKVSINAHDQDNGMTALMFALVKKRLVVANALLKIPDVDKNARDDKGRTALMFAARHGCCEQMKTLLAMGTDIDAQDNELCSALIYAAENGHARCVKVLLDWGASPKSRDCDNYTAQELAEKKGHVTIVKLLKEYV